MKLGTIAIDKDTNQRVRILNVGSKVSEIINIGKRCPILRYRVHMLGANNRSLLHVSRGNLERCLSCVGYCCLEVLMMAAGIARLETS